MLVYDIFDVQNRLFVAVVHLEAVHQAYSGLYEEETQLQPNWTVLVSLFPPSTSETDLHFYQKWSRFTSHLERNQVRGSAL